MYTYVVNHYMVVNYDRLQATVGIHEYAVCIISLFIRKISVRAYYNAMLVQRINFVDMYVCMYVCMTDG